MPFIAERAEAVQQTGLQALRRGEGDAHLLGDFIGGAETDAKYITGKLVGIGADDIDRILPVLFVNAHGQAGADPVTLEEHHDFFDLFLFFPGARNRSARREPMPGTSRSRCGVVSITSRICRPK